MQHHDLPDYISKYFWGDDLSQLNLETNENYILQTLLNVGDQKAIKWLLTSVDQDSIKEKLPKLKLTPQSAHFWNIYLS